MTDINDVIAGIKSAQMTPAEIQKATFSQPGSPIEGLQQYNLEAPAKQLYPVLTPLRNRIARDSGGFNIQANWKAVTGINTSNVRAGVAEGKRGGVIAVSTAEYFAAFRGFGLESSVTFEASYASRNLDDVRARAVLSCLQSTMIQEERLILGGNTSVAMGTTPMPVLSASGSGGSLANGTLSVICVALGLQAYLDVAGANNGTTGQSLAIASARVPGKITRANADGTTEEFGGGSAQKSQNATVSVTGPNGKVEATITPVNGAVGYAWYWGAAGSEVLGAITTINSVSITANAAGTQTAASLENADHSTSTLDFDGLLYQAVKPGSNAYIKTMATGNAGAGTALTSDGAGGIIEFEEAFAHFYNRYRCSPSICFLSAQELINITRKIIGNGGAPLLKLNANVDAKTMAVAAGVVVGSYWNKITGQEIPLVVHPNLAPGTIFFFTETLPYPMNNVSTICRMLMRQEYYQIEWPRKARQDEYGVYADGVLQHYAPFTMGIITNIANG